MPIKTLGGMFCEQKKPNKRNFIKENVQSVTQLEGLLRGLRVNGVGRSNNDLLTMVRQRDSRANVYKQKTNVPSKKKKFIAPSKHYSDRSVQTESAFEDTNGVIVPKLNLNENLSLENKIENIVDDKNTYMKTNTDNLDSQSITKHDEPKAQSRLEEEDCIGIDPFCPPGHKLLDEEERKQTLKNLREKYQQRIKELNSLSVRSDTLRIKKKKMEIEEALKEIDAGIKTFEKVRVYIKTC